MRISDWSSDVCSSDLQRAGAARQYAEQFHAVDHAPDQGDGAVELARRLAVDHVELGAVARVRGHAAPGADRAVAMRHPRLAFGRVARGGEAVHEADLRRPSVLVRQRVEVEAGGGACVSTCRYRWSPHLSKKNKKENIK